MGYVSHGVSTGEWGKDALVSGAIAAGSSWLIYNTAGAATGLLTSAGMNKGAATILGNGIGGAVGSFSGNVAGQAYFTGSVDLGQAGQAALYGLGYGLGSGLVDNTSLMQQRFFMYHTAKHILRSTAGEISGNVLSGGYGDFTFGFNAGMALPFMSDIASETSPYWSSKIAKEKYDDALGEAEKEGVRINSDIDLQAKIDYGYNTEDSGYWIAGSNDGNFIFDEVGISARVKVLSGGITIDQIGPITPKGLNFANLAGMRIDFPIMSLPFSRTSAIHFANAYSMSYRLWYH